MNKRLRDIEYELKQIAFSESIRLWRLARDAEKHGCSKELIHAIREEANDLYTNYTTNPDRLIYWKTKYIFKYAFRY